LNDLKIKDDQIQKQLDMASVIQRSILLTKIDDWNELKFSVKELSDEVSSHALLCPQRTFILYEALGESIDDIYAQLNTISFFNIIRLDFSNLPQAIGKIYMFGKFMPSPDGNGNIIYNSIVKRSIFRKL
jgi:hypothetical protein